MTLAHLPGGPYLATGRPNVATSDPKDIDQLAEPLRTRIRAIIADCPHRGELGLVSGLRDPGRQWDLRLGRVGHANIWRSPPTGSPITAVPARYNPALNRWVGGSRHQTGEAADLGGTARAMAWMRANRERYGLALTVRTEGWHLEANRRDVHTGRVHDRPTAITTPAPLPPRPTPTPPPKGPLMALTDAEQAEILALVRDTHRRTRTLTGWVKFCAEWVAGQRRMTAERMAQRVKDLTP